MQDLHLRPSDYQSGALAAELIGIGRCHAKKVVASAGSTPATARVEAGYSGWLS